MQTKMKIKGTHIPDKILIARNKRVSEAKILEEVQRIFEQEEQKDQLIIEALRDSEDITRNNFNVDKLKLKRIYHLADIEKICIEYRLRFLPSAYFKADLPYEAISKIKQLEKKHNTKLEGFKIMAPAKVFKLENADDPLLFAPIGNEYYYLIHSWGNDLQPFRKLLMWPFKQLENFMLLLLLVSFVLTTLIPNGMFGPEMSTSEFLMIFFFMFKWVAGMALFFGFKKGKNFSADIWRSNYYNA